MFDYIHEPKAIYAESFAIIRREVDLSALPDDVAAIAVRLIHACGMTDIVGDLAWSPDVATAAAQAIADGAPILVDARMVAHGIIRDRLSAGNPVICTLNEPTVSGRAAKAGTTRSAMAVDLWKPQLAGAIVAIGNAPTALFRLLEVLAEGAPRPAVIFGFPVGFVGAAESKDALVKHANGIPYMTLRGRKGGSAMAAAAVNAASGEPA
ncbi:MAG: precorrin-8X methylmutase [Alphaproteobacteria bacterium]|nr:precorrin-8X methylmutase [Alphaproteobacteria bacterium]